MGKASRQRHPHEPRAELNRATCSEGEGAHRVGKQADSHGREPHLLVVREAAIAEAARHQHQLRARLAAVAGEVGGAHHRGAVGARPARGAEELVLRLAARACCVLGVRGCAQVLAVVER